MPNSIQKESLKSQSPTFDYLRKVQDHINLLEQKLAEREAKIERLEGIIEVGRALKNDQEFGLAYQH